MFGVERGPGVRLGQRGLGVGPVEGWALSSGCESDPDRAAVGGEAGWMGEVGWEGVRPSQRFCWKGETGLGWRGRGVGRRIVSGERSRHTVCRVADGARRGALLAWVGVGGGGQHRRVSAEGRRDGVLLTARGAV